MSETPSTKFETAATTAETAATEAAATGVPSTAAEAAAAGVPSTAAAGSPSTATETAAAADPMPSIRANIDATDLLIRDLLIRRMGYAHQVAEAKLAAGSTTVYREDREVSILENLGADVDEDIRVEYLAVVRKILEASRMYQYGLLYDWNDSVFEDIKGHELAETPGNHLVVRLTRKDVPNSMSAILAMIGDYGYNMEWMELVEVNAETKTVTFDLTIAGDLSDTNMKKLVFQLSKETLAFEILENRA